MNDQERNRSATTEVQAIFDSLDPEFRNELEAASRKFLKKYYVKSITEAEPSLQNIILNDMIKEAKKLSDGKTAFETIGPEIDAAFGIEGSESGRREILTPAPHTTGHTEP